MINNLTKEAEYYELSQQQKQIMLAEDAFKGTSVNTLCVLCHVKTNIPAEKIKETMEHIVSKIDTFRVRYIEVGDALKQYFADENNYEVKIVEFQGNPNAYNDYVTDKRNNCLFGYNKELFDISVIITDSGETQLLILVHHSIADGWTLSYLLTEAFCLCMDGKDMEFVSFEDQLRNIKKPETVGEYWGEKIALLYEDSKLGENVNPTMDITANEYNHDLPEGLSESINDVAKRFKVSAAVIFNLAVYINESLYKGTDNLSLGFSFYGRRNKREKRTFGVYARVLPLIYHLDKSHSIGTLLAEVKSEFYNLFRNSNISYYQLEKEARDKNVYGNLIETTVSFQNVNFDENVNKYFSGIEWVTGTTQTIPMEIHISDRFSTGNYNIEYDYIGSRFTEAEIKTYDNHLMTILSELCSEQSEDNRLLSDITCISESERNTLLNEFNRANCDYPKDKTVLDYFLDSVRKYPDKTAVCFEDKPLTYSELDKKSDQIALLLKDKYGVEEGNFVALYMPRSLEMIIGMFATMKLGAAYVPVNVFYPQQRVTDILEDCKPKAILTHEGYHVEETEVPQIDLCDALLYENAIIKYDRTIKPEDVIYIIYTSGTTGKPKGVQVEHRNVVRLFFNSEMLYDFNESDIWMMFHAYGFDFSVWEMYGALLFGGKLVIPNDDVTKDSAKLMKFIKEEEITILNQVPTSFYQLSQEDYEGNDISVRYLIFGGEALDPARLRKWHERHPEVRIINMYGITETTVHVTYREIGDSEIEKGISDIGSAIPTLSVYIMNGNNLCGIGIAGELCVTGAGVSRGYLNRPEENAKKFVENPFGEGRMYRSGDLARWLPDGNIEYLGRIDKQVQVHGFRVELADIEHAINDIENIENCAVIAKNDNENGTYICAYLVSGKTLDLQEIRRKIMIVLPEYMVPSYMMQIDSIPLTINGKLDQKSLPDIEAKSAREYVAPENKEESIMCEVFEEVLGMDKVGIKDNFFELGGDSIKAMRIVSKAREKGYQITVKDLIHFQSVKELYTQGCIDVVKMRYSQEELTGDIPLAPIQNMFFGCNLKYLEHFNQSVVLEGKNIDVESLKKALNELCRHHDMLRAVVREEGKMYVKASQDFLCGFTEETVDTSAEEYALRNQEYLTKWQKENDLKEGPLFRVLLVHCTDSDIVFMTAHHLVIDMVSWRIIYEDLNILYSAYAEHKEAILPEKTLDYKSWTVKLTEYGNSEKVRQELSYWKKISEKTSACHIFKETSEAGHTGKMTEEIPLSVIEGILEKNREKLHVREQEILLAALGMVLKKKYDVKHYSVAVESHGRDAVMECMDVTRTVGWFTCKYPVCFAEKETISDMLIEIKKRLLEVPENGIGYEILRYLNHEESLSTEPEIAFNYLGDTDVNIENEDGNGVSLALSEIKSGETMSSNDRPANPLILDFISSNGNMQMMISYDTSVFKEQEITEFAEAFKETFEEMNREETCKEEVVYVNELSSEILSDADIDIIEERFDINTEVERIYKLSPMQEGMLFLHLTDKNSTKYLIQNSIIFEQKLDNEKVSNAFKKVVNKYSVLRSKFIASTRVPLQVILKKYDLDAQYVDKTDENYSEISIRNISENDFIRTFDLSTELPIRLTNVEYADKSVLIWSIHHIVVDGWSVYILQKDFVDFYRNIATEDINPKRTLFYENYINWLSQKNYYVAEKYWEKVLNGATVTSIKPVEKISEAYVVNDVSTDIDSSLQTKIVECAAENGVTISTVMKSAFAIFLKIFANTNDVIFGEVISGRNSNLEGINNAVGLFINTIPVRIEFSEEDTGANILKFLQNQYIESDEFSYVSLAELQNHIITGKEINILYVCENYYKAEGSEELGELLINKEETNYDLTLNVNTDADGKFVVKLMYDKSMYLEKYATYLLRKYIEILKNMTAESEIAVKDYDILEESERNTLLNEFNRANCDYPKDKTVLDYFLDSVRKYPDKTAVCFEDKPLTYSELDKKSDQIALLLKDKYGVEEGNFVALYMPRSLEMIIGMFATMKLGAAYVPVNVFYPQQRVTDILEDCKPKAILTHEGYHVEETEVPQIDLCDALLYENAIIKYDRTIKPEDVIYIIYTSGTTGKPKGVQVEHRNVVRLFFNSEMLYDFNESDIWMMFHAYGFDFSVWEMYGALLFGGKLVIPNDDVTKDSAKLMKFIKEEEITILNQVPTSFYQLSQEDYEGNDISVRYLIFGGEALDPARLRKWHERHPEVRIINMYGITETTVHVTYREIGDSEIEKGISDIGSAIPTLSVYIMNGNNLCGIGIAGELCVTGAGVSRGYLNRPEENAKKFVENPFGEGRMYRSGDLARWLPDGNIEYLGRIDKQVQVHGFRVELADIEHAINDIENIENCAVIAKNDNENGTYICAYLVSGKTLDLQEIRRKIMIVLPEYMVPSYMMQIDSIPLTINGKLDQKSLPDIEAKSAREYVAPENKEESIMCEVFEEVLGMDKVGIKDNFFELGGDSIKAMRIVSKAREKGYQITVKDLIHFQSVKELYTQGCIDVVKMRYSQEELTGDIPLAPIQNMFFGCNLKYLEHFNQSVVLEGKNIDVESLKKALNELCRHHDMLRAVVREEGKMYVKASQDFLCGFTEETVDTSAEEYALRNQEYLTKWQKENDLKEGPLFRVLLVHCTDSDIVFMTAHHLVIDMVSWRIIYEDLNILYSAYAEHKEAILPEKTLDYKSWTVKLTEYGNSEKVRQELSYWKKISEKTSACHIFKETSEAGHTGKMTEEIPLSVIEGILEKNREKLHVREQEILLAALGMVLKKKYDVKHYSVAVESHGRDAVMECMDVTRTVGWFTCKYPVCFAEKETISDMLIEIKKRLLEVPENGIGYEILRYLNHEESLSTEPEIAFNYLGDTDVNIENEDGNGVSLALSEIKSGETMSSNDRPANPLILDFISSNGNMQMMISYDTSVFKEQEITEFAEAFKETFEEMNREETCKEEVVYVNELSSEILSDADIDIIEGLLF